MLIHSIEYNQDSKLIKVEQDSDLMKEILSFNRDVFPVDKQKLKEYHTEINNTEIVEVLNDDVVSIIHQDSDRDVIISYSHV